MTIAHPTSEERHVQRLLERIRGAKQSGDSSQVRHWVCVYLNSYDAKWLAVRKANAQVKRDRRLKKAELRAIAGHLDAWKGTDEEVLVHLKRKPSNPFDCRICMDFGIENRALQYLVLSALEQLADLVPYQYTIRGGTKAAIMHVVKAISSGPVWAIELDVNDCYPSFDGKKLASLLPLPKEVSEHVLISEYLNLKGGNISYYFGPTGDDDPGAPFLLEETLVEARQGIPQGSATSSLTAEMMLALALRKVPDIGEKIGYGDNSLLLAKEEGELVAMTKALESALKAHPVGLFRPKAKKFLPGQPIEFLGHQLTPKSGGKVHIAPNSKNREKFKATMAAKLQALKYGKLSAQVMVRQRHDARHYVRSWTSAFSLCDGIQEWRSYWLAEIKAASPLGPKSSGLPYPCLLGSQM